MHVCFSSSLSFSAPKGKSQDCRKLRVFFPSWGLTAADSCKNCMLWWFQPLPTVLVNRTNEIPPWDEENKWKHQPERKCVSWNLTDFKYLYQEMNGNHCLHWLRVVKSRSHLTKVISINKPLPPSPTTIATRITMTTASTAKPWQLQAKKTSTSSSSSAKYPTWAKKVDGKIPPKVPVQLVLAVPSRRGSSPPKNGWTFQRLAQSTPKQHQIPALLVGNLGGIPGTLTFNQQNEQKNAWAMMTWTVHVVKKS